MAKLSPGSHTERSMKISAIPTRDFPTGRGHFSATRFRRQTNKTRSLGTLRSGKGELSHVPAPDASLSPPLLHRTPATPPSPPRVYLCMEVRVRYAKDTVYLVYKFSCLRRKQEANPRRRCLEAYTEESSLFMREARTLRSLKSVIPWQRSAQ